MKRKVLSPEEIAELIKYQSTHSDNSTMQKFGLSRPNYNKILADNNIKRHPASWGRGQSRKASLTELDKKAIIDFYKDNNIKSTCSKFHIKEKHLREIFAEYNIIEHTAEEKMDIMLKNLKQTLVDKYNVDNITKDEATIKRIRATNLKKYGVDWYTKTSEYKNRVSETCLQKYGVTSYSACSKRKTELRTNAENWLAKKYRTQKLNSTFNTSRIEKEFYKLLQEKYGDSDVVWHYSNDSRYPFECDFYIKSLDLFIELHITWTHGGMPFDPELDICRSKLTNWTEKALVSKYYKNAIYTWTDLDIRKHASALTNKLNYLVFYNKGEILNWLKEENKEN